MIDSESIPIPARYLTVRTLVERIAVVVAAPLLLPVMASIAIAIRIDSSGPVLFRQRRPGREGRIFEIMKFRTMHVNDGGGVPVQSIDARITRVGRLLRAYHLDELPQLWNVLRGEISLVGPRPLPLAMEDRFRKAIPGYDARYRITPGITGWAQINQGYTDDTEGARRKLELDLYYIENLSLRLDITILMRTIGTVIRRQGVR